MSQQFINQVSPLPLTPLRKDATLEEAVEAYNKLLDYINNALVRQIQNLEVT